MGVVGAGAGHGVTLCALVAIAWSQRRADASWPQRFLTPETQGTHHVGGARSATQSTDAGR